MLGAVLSVCFLGEILGGIIGAASDSANTRATNKANLELYRMQRDDQRADAAKAVQTRAADLKAAGFNPVLAAGQAAQVTSASPAPTLKSEAGKIMGDSVARAGGAAKDWALAKAQIEHQKAITDNQTMQNKRDSMLTEVFGRMLNQQLDKGDQDISHSQAQVNALNEQINQSKHARTWWANAGYPGADLWPEDAKKAVLVMLAGKGIINLAKPFVEAADEKKDISGVKGASPGTTASGRDLYRRFTR